MKNLRSKFSSKITSILLLFFAIFILSCEGTNFSVLTLEEKSEDNNNYTEPPDRNDFSVEVKFTIEMVTFVMYNFNTVNSFWSQISHDEYQFECKDGEPGDSFTVTTLNSYEVTVIWERHNREIICDLNGTPSSASWYSQSCITEFLTNCYYDVGTTRELITVSVTRL